MIIELGTISYMLIIPLFYPFFYQIRRVIHNGDKKPFYEFFTNYCGYLFSGVVYFIITRRMKKIKDRTSLKGQRDSGIYMELTTVKERSESRTITTYLKSNKPIKSITVKGFDNQIDLEKEKIKSINTKKKYLFLLLLTTIYLIPMYLDSYCSSNEDLSFKTSSTVSLFFCLISYVTLSRIILGDKVYRHQYFSLVIIIVCNIITNVLILLHEDTSNIVVNFVLMFVILSLYAAYNVLEKKYFNIYMDSPYHLMFIVGLISLIVILFYETITVLAFGKDRVFNGIFYQIQLNFENIKLYPLLFIGDVLSAFLWVAGIHLTVYFFTPCHFIISESVSQIISTIINNTLENRPLYIKVIIYVLFCVILFAAFIYNEVIIIKVCSLDENTKRHIQDRAKCENEEQFDDEQIMNKNILEETLDYSNNNN